MNTDQHFWWTTIIRGFLALVVGSAVMVIPDMARTLLLLPMALAMAILGLAVYGVLDSALVFVTSYMAASRPAKIALRIQGVVGVTVGILLYRVFFDHVQLTWFLILIAIQALATAVAEYLVARHSMTKSTSYWNFATAIVALIFSCTYVFIAVSLAANMTPQEISWLVFGYLLAFGIAQCMTAARMLYADHRLVLANLPTEDRQGD